MSILKDELVNSHIESLQPIRPNEDKQANIYIGQAVANFKGLKASELLIIIEDFALNVGSLYHEESVEQEQINQALKEFNSRFKKSFNKLEISNELQGAALESVVWHSFTAITAYAEGNLYAISAHVNHTQKIIVANHSAKNALKENAKKGGLNNVRAQSYQVARKRAYELYQQGTFKNLTRAAKAILPTLKKEGLTRYLTGEEESQYKTVRHWLKKQVEQKA